MTDASETPPRPGPAKGPAAFRTISEASAEVGVPQHVLRFWETRFAFIRPTKRAGGRRFYRPQDLEVLRGVRALLQDEGYTIKGVQKLHKEQGLKRLLAATGVGEAAAARLADAVEAQDADEPTDAPVADRAGGVLEAAAPPPALVTEPDGAERTGDLFGGESDEATARDADSDAAAGAAAVSLDRRGPIPRPAVLDASARARLSEVLDDLEAAKADIDALLAEG